jgi:myo-inositol 2-dehydrogenase/D-chiro-inositol 1-dehydrogenase
MHDVGVGLVGSGFASDIHARAFRRVAAAKLIAAASPNEAHVKRFAERHSIPAAYTDYRRLLENREVDVICVGAPNYLHRDVVVTAAEAHKQVICEKPLARTLAEADEMVTAADGAGVQLMYAEQLCFAPKYVRAKELVDEGAVGDLFQVLHSEQHSGPHTAWFWDGALAGGGVLMDMGCHAIEFIRWMYGKPRVESVTAEIGTFVHGNRTSVDDHAVAIIHLDGNRTGLVQASWDRQGGIDDRAELLGSNGVVMADLLRGSSLVTFSQEGYGYAAEKAPSTRGWTFTMFEELWNLGYPQEMDHFIDCVINDKPATETGRDGRTVLEIVYAMYLSAGLGQRVSLPLELPTDRLTGPPLQGWKSVHE